MTSNINIPSSPGYKKLLAWQQADKLVKMVYKFSLSFPKEEVYGFTSQLRRAALSVVLNIVEGHGRNNKNEFRHFLSLTLGSLAETEYLLELALNLKYLSVEDFQQISDLRSGVGQLTWKLYLSQK